MLHVAMRIFWPGNEFIHLMLAPLSFALDPLYSVLIISSIYCILSLHIYMPVLMSALLVFVIESQIQLRLAEGDESNVGLIPIMFRR